jgi:dienelactone hydrolase
MRATRMTSTDNPAPLNAVATESVSCSGNVMRRRIEYDTTDGLRIPAYLFVPETDRPVPAVIVYHGHGDGKINAAEREGTNENMIAGYLAETLGYVALAPDARTFGEFAVQPPQNHEDYYSGLLERNLLFMSKLMEDGCRDMALLRETPEADETRIGAAGISMGAWRTLNHAVLHEEIRAAVIAGLFLPWDYLFSEKHCRCQHIPALANKMAAEDFAATIFPRDLMIQWGLDDQYYKMDAEGLIARTGEIADFLGYSDHFSVDRHPGMGHMFSNPEVASFFNARLGPGAWKPKM